MVVQTWGLFTFSNPAIHKDIVKELEMIFEWFVSFITSNAWTESGLRVSEILAWFKKFQLVFISNF